MDSLQKKNKTLTFDNENTVEAILEDLPTFKNYIITLVATISKY